MIPFNNEVLTQLESWFDEYGIKYAKDAKTGVLRTNILSELDVKNLRVDVCALEDTYLVKASYIDFIVPKQSINAIMEFILRVNVPEMYLSFDFDLSTVVSIAHGESFYEDEMQMNDLQSDAELAASRITDFLPYIKRVVAGENPEKVADEALKDEIGEISHELFSGDDEDWSFLDEEELDGDEFFDGDGDDDFDDDFDDEEDDE